MENKEMKDMEMARDTHQLTEGDLAGVAGGEHTYPRDGTACYFVHKGQRRNKNGRLEALCGSTCAGIGQTFMYCACRNHPDRICIDRWHHIAENGSPLPREAKGHAHWYA